MTPKKYVDDLEKVFIDLADPSLVFKMEKYMKNKFSYYGVKSPLRNEIKKEFINVNGYLDYNSFVEAGPIFWSKKREIAYVYLDMMRRYNKKNNEDYIMHVEKLILDKSWWDTVDNLAAHAVGTYFMRFPEQRDSICQKWMKSNNMWLQRSVIIHQLFYKEKTDFNFLKRNILQLSDSKEFFIQKALGWSLRQYSKTNPSFVLSFIEKNDLPKLTVREGLKYLSK